MCSERAAFLIFGSNSQGQCTRRGRKGTWKSCHCMDCPVRPGDRFRATSNIPQSCVLIPCLRASTLGSSRTRTYPSFRIPKLTYIPHFSLPTSVVLTYAHTRTDQLLQLHPLSSVSAFIQITPPSPTAATESRKACCLHVVSCRHGRLCLPWT